MGGWGQTVWPQTLPSYNLCVTRTPSTAGNPTLNPTAHLVNTFTPTLASRAHDLPSTPALIAFLHATARFPIKQMWLATIKRGTYASWSWLTYTLAARYCPSANEMLQGHTAQPCQHIRSTQQSPGASTPGPLTDTNHGTDIVIVPINQLFMDDTG